MTPEQFGQYMRDDIAQVDEARQGAQHPDRRLMAHTTAHGGGGHRRAAGHAHPRRVRRRASVRAAGTQRRPRGASHAPELGRLRDRRLAPPDASKPRWPRWHELEPAPQATVLGRDERVDIASAALLNGITSHTFDFDDTHLKTIIHPAGPVASAALALAEQHRRIGRAAASTRWCSASTSRAASATRSIPTTTIAAGTSPGPPACSARRPPARGCCELDAAQDGDGARHRRVAADRRARAVRLDDQAVPSRRRRARRTHVGADGAATATRRRRARSRRRAACCRRSRPSATGTRSPTSSASASRSRSTPTSRSPAASSSIRASTAASSSRRRTAWRADDIERIDAQGASAGARAHRQDDAAHRPRGQVQRLPRLRGRHLFGPGGRSRVLRRGRRAARSSSRCATEIHAIVDAAIDEAAADVTIDCSDGRKLHSSSSTRSAASSGR